MFQNYPVTASLDVVLALRWSIWNIFSPWYEKKPSIF